MNRPRSNFEKLAIICLLIFANSSISTCWANQSINHSTFGLAIDWNWQGFSFACLIGQLAEIKCSNLDPPAQRIAIIGAHCPDIRSIVGPDVRRSATANAAWIPKCFRSTSRPSISIPTSHSVDADWLPSIRGCCISFPSIKTQSFAPNSQRRGISWGKFTVLLLHSALVDRIAINLHNLSRRSQRVIWKETAWFGRVRIPRLQVAISVWIEWSRIEWKRSILCCIVQSINWHRTAEVGGLGFRRLRLETSASSRRVASTKPQAQATKSRSLAEYTNQAIAIVIERTKQWINEFTGSINHWRYRDAATTPRRVLGVSSIKRPISSCEYLAWNAPGNWLSHQGEPGSEQIQLDDRIMSSKPKVSIVVANWVGSTDSATSLTADLPSANNTMRLHEQRIDTGVRPAANVILLLHDDALCISFVHVASCVAVSETKRSQK